MQIATYLQKQFINLNAVFHALVDDITEEEWVSRPGPGQNMIGSTVWHIPRTQDNFLQAWIRGQVEVVHGGRWTQWQHLKPLGIGVGITLKESDEIACTVQRSDVVDYADEVHQTMCRWLDETSAEVLDQIPDAKQYLVAFPEYQTPGYIAEINNLYDLPIWALLIRPCMGHLHRHLGELEITKDMLRKSK